VSGSIIVKCFYFALFLCLHKVTFAFIRTDILRQKQFKANSYVGIMLALQE